MQRRILSLVFLTVLLALNLQCPSARAQGTAFSYYGHLNDSGGPATGVYDLTFTLFGTNSGGVTVAGPLTNLATTVSNGLFAATLDFGPGVFNGSNYWLDVAVRTSGSNNFTELSPRQPILATPYAVMANSALNLAGSLPASQLAGKIPMAMLPNAVVTNGAKNVSISGSFAGDASGLTGLPAQNIAGGSNVWVSAMNGNVTNLNLSGSFISTNSLWNYFLYNMTGTNPSAAQQPMIAQSIHGGNLNYLDTLLIACAYDLPNNYADIQFGNFKSTDIGSAYPQFNCEAVMGLSSFGGNWNFPYPGQSNYGVYDGAWNGHNSFVLELEGGNPYVIVGDPYSGGLIPQVILSRNYEHYFITDQQTGETNYFDFNKTNATFYVPYGPVVAAGFHTTNGGIYSGDGSGLTNLSFGNFAGAVPANKLPANLAPLAQNDGRNLININAANIIGVIAQSDLPGFQGTYDTVGGGANNIANGGFSTVPGGANNRAYGVYSFAAGRNAQAGNAGTFVWSDASGATTSSMLDNSVTMRASGGFRFLTGMDNTTGAQLLAGDTSWSAISDRNAKKNIKPVDGSEVLNKLARVPIAQWNYKWQSDDDTPNIGPMAQDFKAAFYPGRDDHSISTLEFDGVELAAIQELNHKLKIKDAEINNLKQQNDLMAARLDKLEKAIGDKKEAR